MFPIFPYQSMIPQQAQQKTVNYVNGKANVESALLGPGSSDVYVDTQNKKFYIKEVNQNGIAVIKGYDFKESEEEKPIEYVTKAEFEIFKAAMKGVEHGSGTDNNDDNQQ